MIKLITLPGANLDCPDINMPILKGFLAYYGIETIHYDLNILSIYKKLSYENLLNYFAEDDEKVRKQKIQQILDSISILNGTVKEEYEGYLRAGDILKGIMYNISKSYEFVWLPKRIVLNKKLCSDNIIKESIENKMFVFFEEVFEECLRSLSKEDKFVVISAINESQFLFAIHLSRLIKEKINTRIMIVGNYLPYIEDSLPKISIKWIDYYILGYPEDAILDLINSENNKDLHSTGGSVIIKTKQWEDKKNLKEFHESNHLKTVPDFSDLDLSQYLSKELVLPLLISNGCFYGKCKFCSFHYGDGRHFLRNLESIKNCLDVYVNKYNVKSILFIDKCIPASVVMKFCKYIVEKQYNIKWLLETRIDQAYAKDKNIALLRNAGCKFISFGIESASQEILDKMDKRINFELAKECMNKISKTEICVAATIMILYLEESEETLHKTFDFLLDNTIVDLFGILKFALMKYSPLYFQHMNELIEPESDLGQKYGWYSVKGISLESEKMKNLIAEFYSQPIIREHLNTISKTLYRSHYLLWSKEKYSIQWKKV